MRCEHEGMSLWYGTPDTPAPEGAVLAGTDITITVAVQPVDASNKVELLYRIDQGPVETVAARWLHNDLAHKAQHFRAHFPTLRVADTVEYAVVCHCAGRQVPHHEEAQQLTSSFHIIAPQTKPTVSSAEKEMPTPRTTDGSDSVEGTVPHIDANKGAVPHVEHVGGKATARIAPTIQQHSMPLAEPGDSAVSEVHPQGAPSEGSTTHTPSGEMPPKKSFGKEHKEALAAVLGTSPALADPELANTLLDLYAEHQGSMHEFWQKLPEHSAFKEPGTVEKVQLTLQLGIVTQHHLPLLNALQDLHQQGTVQSTHDLTKLDDTAWKQLINSTGGSVPAHIPGATHEDQVTNFAGTITNMVHQTFPTTSVAQHIAKKPAIDLPLVRNVLAQNSHVNPQHPVPDNLTTAGMSESDQAKAKASMEALHREIKVFPGFDHTTALTAPTFHNPVRQAVSQFLNNAPGFDLQRTHIDNFLAQHGEAALQGIDPQHQTAAASQLKTMQRVSQLTPNPELQDALLSEGLHSAHSIASIPQSTFIMQFSDKLGGTAQASMIYERAQAVSAVMVHTFALIHQAAYDVTPRAIGSPQKVLESIKSQSSKQLPDLDTLFGSLDFCDCDHCRSVYSPAAYFVDLLQFLDKSLLKDGKSPQAVLFERRPDLQHIKLSCENTNTLIPYVDLVNEVLESYLAFNTPFDPAITDDVTSPTAEELSANPQHTNEAAYTLLQNAIYPFSLPFNRSLEIARVYLEHLGSSRYEVMKTFQKNDGPSGPTPSSIALACEYLKISPEEYTILVPPTPSDALWKLYGYAEKSSLVVKGPPVDSGLAPDFGPGGGLGVGIEPTPESWGERISRVPEFLQQTGISYDDLIVLVQTRFLNPEQKITLDTPPAADPCNLENITIKNLDENVLNKAYRFIRLWRKLGWPIQNLDKVMRALGATEIDEAFLQNLAQVIQLQRDLSIPLAQVLSLWATIDTRGDDSLYNKLFQNKAIIKPTDPTFAIFSLNDDGSELKTVGAKIVDSVPVLLSALRITAADWAALWNALTTAKVLDDTALINLANLSTLYSYTALAKALKLSIQDFLTLKVLLMPNPFTTVSLASTIDFIGKVRKVRESGFSIAHLNYLYRHLYEPNRGIAPLQATVVLLFKSIQDGLKKIVNDNDVMPDPTGDLLRRKLLVLLDKGSVDAAMQLIDGSAQTAQATQMKKATQADQEQFIKDQEQFIEDHFALFLNTPDSGTSTSEAKTKLVGTAALSNKEERIAYILKPLVIYLRVSLSQAFVKQALSDALKLDTAMTDVLIRTILKSRSDTSKMAIVDFLALSGADLSTTMIPPIASLQAYSLLHKVALLISMFTMTVKEVQYFSRHGIDFAGFDFNTLPLDPSAFTQTLFEQWERLADFFTLRNSLPQGDVGLADVFEATIADTEISGVSDAVMKQLLAATGWDAIELATVVGWDAQHLAALISEGPQSLTPLLGMDTQKLTPLIGTNGFNLGSMQLKNVAQLLALQACLKLGRTLGISVKHLFDWASDVPDATQAEEIKNTVKAKYDDAQWLNLAKSLNDGLRERQRDALVAYLLQMPDIKQYNVNNSSQLYEHFLIDVDMSACMLTSRIVQALSTIQLFVQRCLMNLEQDVFPTAIDSDEWKWMKRYRVWEANRKVFLYPENWIEPELRDNKSPIFKELETELLQNDITMDTAEQTFLNYLEKLDQVARLEICGMYWEEEVYHPEMSPPQLEEVVSPQLDWRDLSALDRDKHVDKLHVFGRTFSTPHIYYYRQLIDNTTWTPWEKINLDIEGDHLIPVVWNRRIHLFWPIFAEKADPEQNVPTQNTPSTPKKYLEVKFAWSEYKQNKWSGKQVSVESIRSDVLEKENHIFRTQVDSDGNLIIRDIQKIYKDLLILVIGGPPIEKDFDVKEAWFTFSPCNGRVNTSQLTASILSLLGDLGHTSVNVHTAMPVVDTAMMRIEMPLMRRNGGDGGGDTGDDGDGTGKGKGGGTHSGPGKGGGTGTGTGGGTPSAPPDIMLGVAAPETSHPKFMEYVEATPGSSLIMLTGDFDQIDDLNMKTLDAKMVGVPTLDTTPSIYHILGPHQFPQFTLQAPFFYQDNNRTYFVSPEHSANFGIQLSDPNHVTIPIQRVPSGIFVPPPLPGHVVSISPGHTVRHLPPPEHGIGKPPQPLMRLNGGGDDGGDETAPHHKQPGAGSAPASGTTGTTAQGASPVGGSTVVVPPSLIGQLAGTVIPPTSAIGQLAGTVVPPVTSVGNLAGTVLSPGGTIGNKFVPIPRLRFITHFHPHICTFVKTLNRSGIPGLLTLENQKYSDSVSYSASGGPPVALTPIFKQKYGPNTSNVSMPYPAEEIDFSPIGAYSLYNWELFFHIPMLIATKLSKNQRFEEAQQWFHYIFNPTVSSSIPPPQRYWNVFPFQTTEAQRIQDMLALLDSNIDSDARKAVEKQVQEWRSNAFQPHAIARLRLIAYQKNVVMKYIDNLIAWGDQLFRQDTIESINEATQLYILAYDILGPRPQQLPARSTKGNVSYYDLLHDPDHKLDDFSNTLVTLENQLPFSSTTSSSVNGASAAKSLGSITVPLFCVPQNDKLLGYWDTVADRLFKIRHCMNIEGVVRQLPLFAPPIDPALLVQAAAMGVDLSSALNDMNAATPYYRFTYMLQKALELCADLKALGAALLSALEKKDGEALSALRATQETNVLKAARLVKEQQLEEATTTLEGLQKTRQVTEIRYTFYKNIAFMNDWEIAHLTLMGVSAVLQLIEQIIQLTASGTHYIPNFLVGGAGFAASPVAIVQEGGTNIGSGLESFGKAMGVLASLANTAGTMSSTMGSYQRRADDWKLQEDLASKELEQIDKQMVASNIRITIAQQELDNHDKQIENASAIEDFLRDKYTNQDLYDWMITQTSAIFFQSYQMAYDMAKRVEKTYQFERGLTSSDYINFGYWDSLKKGLLAGEQLYLDLKRLETAYMDQNKREYEITKQISLVLHDPLALIALKESGACQISLPEMLFDMDYPGHYMRRIKSVTLTIPCVTGPYTSVNCTLTLLSHKVRVDAQRAKQEQDDESHIVSNFSAVQSIATSNAQNDSGMFELNFRDERYLPFEGVGVVSTWLIEMPSDCNAFDFETISDVIIKLNYTAREGGNLLRNAALTARENALSDPQTKLARMFSTKHEFPGEWYRFLHPTDMTSGQQILPLDITLERFPFQYRGRTLDIHAMKLFLKVKNGFTYKDDLAFVLRKADAKDATVVTEYPANATASFKTDGSPIEHLPYAEPFPGQNQDQTESIGKWSIVVKQDDIKKIDPTAPSLQQVVKMNGQDVVRLNPDAIEDIRVVCEYALHPRSQGTGN